MSYRRHRYLLFLFLVAFFSTSVDANAHAGEECHAAVWDTIHDHYQELPPNGKAMTGAAIGFVGIRIALKLTTHVVKYGAAAYITAEVLHLTGVMNEMPSLSEKQSKALQQFKSKALQAVENFGVKARERLLKGDSVETFFDRERMAAFGFAGGAIAGVIL